MIPPLSLLNKSCGRTITLPSTYQVCKGHQRDLLAVQRCMDPSPDGADRPQEGLVAEHFGREERGRGCKHATLQLLVLQPEEGAAVKGE